ncbi:hypothetical protein HDU98_004220, partial [Podochytrium sp. JEL0797]
MGVQLLWPLLDPARRVEALEALCAFWNADHTGPSTDTEPPPYCHRGISVAVDASVWLNSSAPTTMTFGLAAHSSKTAMPISPRIIQAKTLLARVLRLLSLGATPVFVFDHCAADPRFETGAFSPQDDRIKTEFARLLDVLRVPWFVAAPGMVAEAECARLNAKGVVEAVMSDDGDCFLFGGKT